MGVEDAGTEIAGVAIGPDANQLDRGRIQETGLGNGFQFKTGMMNTAACGLF
jgi:hypothetical protein